MSHFFWHLSCTIKINKTFKEAFMAKLNHGNREMQQSYYDYDYRDERRAHSPRRSSRGHSRPSQNYGYSNEDRYEDRRRHDDWDRSERFGRGAINRERIYRNYDEDSRNFDRNDRNMERNRQHSRNDYVNGRYTQPGYNHDNYDNYDEEEESLDYRRDDYPHIDGYGYSARDSYEDDDMYRSHSRRSPRTRRSNSSTSTSKSSSTRTKAASGKATSKKASGKKTSSKKSSIRSASNKASSKKTARKASAKKASSNKSSKKSSTKRTSSRRAFSTPSNANTRSDNASLLLNGSRSYNQNEPETLSMY